MKTAAFDNINTVREVTLAYGRMFAPLSAPIGRPSPAVDLFRSMVPTNATREHFCALYLDARNRVIGSGIISIGTLSACMVHPREVFAPAVHLLANAVIVGHNHPTGDVRPSNDDDTLTRRLAEAGEVLGIKLLDHLVFDAGEDGAGSWYGYAESFPRALAPAEEPAPAPDAMAREDAGPDAVQGAPCFFCGTATPYPVSGAGTLPTCDRCAAEGDDFSEAHEDAPGYSSCVFFSDLMAGARFTFAGSPDVRIRVGNNTHKAVDPATGKPIGRVARVNVSRDLSPVHPIEPDAYDIGEPVRNAAGYYRSHTVRATVATRQAAYDLIRNAPAYRAAGSGVFPHYNHPPAAAKVPEAAPASNGAKRCECSDPACPVHFGGSCHAEASQVLSHIDIGGATVGLCDACADDTHGSGAFVNVPDTAEAPAPAVDLEDEARSILDAFNRRRNFAYHGDLPMGTTWGFAGIGDVHRDSDTTTRSNHRVIYRDLSERFPNDVEIVHTSHFAVGWYDHLAIRVLGGPDETTPTAVLAAVLEWGRALENYPVASDEDLSEIEWGEISDAIYSTQAADAVSEFLHDRDGFDGHAESIGGDSFRALYGWRIDDVLRERAEHDGREVAFNLRKGDLDFIPPVTDPLTVDTMREDGNEDGADAAEEMMRAWARRETLAGIEALAKANRSTFAEAATDYQIPAWYFGPYRETAAALKSFESTPDLFFLTVDHPAEGYAADPGATASEDTPGYGVPINLDDPDDPCAWNPRYVLFAHYHGRGPTAQRKADRAEYGHAINIPFFCWIGCMRQRFKRSTPSAFIGDAIGDLAAWDAFLLAETEKRVKLRREIEDGPHDLPIPLADLRDGDRVRILGEQFNVDSEFAKRWQVYNQTACPAYAVILAGEVLNRPDPTDEDARGDASTAREDGPEYGARRPWRIGDRVQLWQPGFPSGTVTKVNPAGSVLVHWDDEERVRPDRDWVAAGDVTEGTPGPVRPAPGFWGRASEREDALNRAKQALLTARVALRSAGADKAAAAVCRAIKSTDGAIRHAERVADRQARIEDAHRPGREVPS